jgi:RNA polymerase sigma factor (TIGR02999 family)
VDNPDRKQPGQPAPGSPAQPNARDSAEITALLRRVGDGDRPALDSLFAAVYDELKRLAHAQRLRWSGDETLNTTGIVHEAYMKLVRHGEVSLTDSSHFYAVASRAMRQILVNYAERRVAAKRGSGASRVPLDEVNPVAPEAATEVLALHDALGRLAELDERQGRIVEYRFFAGLSVVETAELLGLSPATVKRDWAVASAWLRREMTETSGSSS